MTSVFLSYDREDIGRARPIAAALEKAGHSIWWDRHIKGGAQFSKEIEQALTRSDVVVVLWSRHSVESAWVRDEAATGRDSGRLVPTTVDGTQPPLGFRQFQTIDLSEWKGRGRSDGIDELLEAIGAVTAAPSAASDVPRSAEPRRTRIQRVPRWLAASIAVLVAAATGGGWWWASREVPQPPIVAIDAAGGSERSREVARQLAIRLGELQSPRSDTFQLVSGGGKADLRLEVEAEDGPRLLRRDISILSGAKRSILWSTSLQQSPDKADDLAQQLAVTSALVLSCGLEALSDKQDRIDPPTLKLYFSGCSRLANVYGAGTYDPNLAQIFERVIAKAPHLSGAWAKLFATKFEATRDPLAPPAFLAKLRRQIAQAERLGVRVGEVHAAKAGLLPADDFVGIFALYDQGIEADPDNAFLYRLRAEQWQRVGRMGDSIGDADRALRLDPLSPALLDAYVSALAYAGKVDTAYEQLRKAEAIWPKSENLQQARYRLDLRFGDPNEALALYRQTTPGSFDPAQEYFILARINPTSANVDLAINRQRAIHSQYPFYIAGIIQALAQFGRKEEVLDILSHYSGGSRIGFNAEVLFRPAMRDVWRDPRAIAAAAHLGLLKYWKASGRWPDFCEDPSLPYNCKAEAAKYRV